MTLPYLQAPPRILGFTPYFELLVLGLLAGAATAWAMRKRFAVTDTAVILIATCGIAAAFVCAHVVDVWAYGPPENLPVQPGRWLRLWEGIALPGALAGVAIVAFVVARAQRLDGWKVADLVALSCLVAMTIGRIGCALVHDHAGAPTDSVFGVDFPSHALGWSTYRPYSADDLVERRHDLGLDELLALVPITGLAFGLAAARLRAGSVAIVSVLAYAGVRFALDFLRSPESDPRIALLTFAQWSCLAAGALALVALVRLATRPTAR